jgi:hypothetical protein
MSDEQKLILAFKGQKVTITSDTTPTEPEPKQTGWLPDWDKVILIFVLTIVMMGLFLGILIFVRR